MLQDMINGDVVKVLIVEDDAIPAAYLKEMVEESGEFVVEDIVTSADEALEVFRDIKPQLVFMDIMIEGPMSGAELAVRLHDIDPHLLIIFATAYSTPEMVDYAVESEAFAYLLKPYRPREIAATLRLAKARIVHPVPQPPQRYVKLVDGYRYDTETNRLYVGEDMVDLPPGEMHIIQILSRHPNVGVPKEAILEQLQISDEALRALVYRIRKTTTPELIQSIKRFGYRIGMKAR